MGFKVKSPRPQALNPKSMVWYLQEVLDSMIRPGRFHKHYGWSYPCIMFLTLPTSIFVNWAYTDTIKEDGGMLLHSLQLLALAIAPMQQCFEGP